MDPSPRMHQTPDWLQKIVEACYFDARRCHTMNKNSLFGCTGVISPRFDELIRKHGPMLLRTAQRVLRDSDDAADCFQEAMLRAFEKIDLFDGRSKLSSWLYRIVINTCLMSLRASKARPTEPIDDLLPVFDSDDCRIESRTRPPGLDPKNRRHQKEGIRCQRTPKTHGRVQVGSGTDDGATRRSYGGRGCQRARPESETAVNWRNALRRRGELSAEVEQETHEAELTRLRQQVRELRMEREILKKAVFFAKETE